MSVSDTLEDTKDIMNILKHLLEEIKKEREESRKDREEYNKKFNKLLNDFKQEQKADREQAKAELEQYLKSRTLGKYHTHADDCTFCLHPLIDEKVGRLPCDHHFHLNCVNRWITTNKWCPICRKSSRK